MKHKDGIHNWDKWEDMFEATLRKDFGLEPTEGPSRRGRVQYGPTVDRAVKHMGWRTAGTSAQPYSRSALNVLAREHGLEIDDKTGSGGNLWVRADGSNELVNQVLTRWEFRFKVGKGWWK